jgi:hypothetical protein
VYGIPFCKIHSAESAKSTNPSKLNTVELRKTTFPFVNGL